MSTKIKNQKSILKKLGIEKLNAMQEEAQAKLTVASTADGKGGTKISLSRKAMQAAIDGGAAATIFEVTNDNQRTKKRKRNWRWRGRKRQRWHASKVNKL